MLCVTTLAVCNCPHANPAGRLHPRATAHHHLRSVLAALSSQPVPPLGWARPVASGWKRRTASPPGCLGLALRAHPGCGFHKEDALAPLTDRPGFPQHHALSFLAQVALDGVTSSLVSVSRHSAACCMGSAAGLGLAVGEPMQPCTCPVHDRHLTDTGCKTELLP